MQNFDSWFMQQESVTVLLVMSCQKTKLTAINAFYQLVNSIN